MSLTVKISINDEKGRKAEIELKEADNLAKLVIVENVFKLFGIGTDVLEMAATYEKVGKAYSQFFNSMDNEEVKKESILHNVDEIKTKMIEGFQDTEEIKEVYQTTKDQPEWVTTGIKEENGSKRYRCRYHCTLCGNRGSHYIYPNSIETWCHVCGHKMRVYKANPNGERDTFGNYFRAGDFQDFNVVLNK